MRSGTESIGFASSCRVSKISISGRTFRKWPESLRRRISTSLFALFQTWYSVQKLIFRRHPVWVVISWTLAYCSSEEYRNQRERRTILPVSVLQSMHYRLLVCDQINRKGFLPLKLIFEWSVSYDEENRIAIHSVVQQILHECNRSKTGAHQSRKSIDSKQWQIRDCLLFQ